MNRKNLFIAGLIFFMSGLLFLNGCKKEDNDETPQEIKKTVSGYVQKGPFINGTSIMVFALDQGYTETGSVFSTEISNSNGDFQLYNITLPSNFIKLKATGFYYNEVCGSNSVSQISLNAICDLSVNSSVCVNVLTHIEKPRVEYLLSNGIDFATAKATAQSEVLNIFTITPQGSIQNSELLNISGATDGDAVLLALSSILQGYRSESELSSLLSVISMDIRTDGVLHDSASMSALIDHALHLDTIAIRNNLTAYYQSLGSTVTIGNFEKYIRQFVDNSDFPVTHSALGFPLTGINGDNVLDKARTVYSGTDFSIKVNLKKCMKFKMKWTLISGNQWGLVADPAYFNWNITPFNGTDQTFTVIDPEGACDLHYTIIPTLNNSVFRIDYYENDTTNITFSKTVAIN